MKNNSTDSGLYYGSSKNDNKQKGVRKHKHNFYMSLYNNFYKMLIAGIFVFVFVLFMRSYVIQHVVVDGSSMNNTLANSDHLLIEKVSYKFSKPERFDVIVFNPYEDDKECYYIKRVIGLPGEKVQIVDGYVYINGSKLDEKYGLNETITNPGIAEYTLELADNEYFVLGDNREVSLDSRDGRVGLVSGTQIIGRALIDFWPVKHFTIIK